jgi:hypothetical protein
MMATAVTHIHKYYPIRLNIPHKDYNVKKVKAVVLLPCRQQGGEGL